MSLIYAQVIIAKFKDGKHVEADDDEDPEFDSREYRKILKTQNGSIVKLQR